MSKRVITCPGCGQDKPHEARGRCHACYRRALRHSEDLPEAMTKSECGIAGRQQRERNRQKRIETYRVLTREKGWTRKKATRVMGIHRDTAGDYERILRERERE